VKLIGGVVENIIRELSSGRKRALLIETMYGGERSDGFGGLVGEPVGGVACGSSGMAVVRMDTAEQARSATPGVGAPGSTYSALGYLTSGAASIAGRLA
jgi:hypothetical protein